MYQMFIQNVLKLWTICPIILDVCLLQSGKDYYTKKAQTAYTSELYLLMEVLRITL